MSPSVPVLVVLICLLRQRQSRSEGSASTCAQVPAHHGGQEGFTQQPCGCSRPRNPLSTSFFKHLALLPFQSGPKHPWGGPGPRALIKGLAPRHSDPVRTSPCPPPVLSSARPRDWGHVFTSQVAPSSPPLGTAPGASVLFPPRQVDRKELEAESQLARPCAGQGGRALSRVGTSVP